MTKSSKVLVVCASPRHNGNSAILADAAAEGAKKAGHDVETVFLDDYVEGMLRDCRTCRNVEGDCSIDDLYGELFLMKFLPADAVIFATPLHYYGMTGRLKTFFDRIFCFTSDSAPDGSINAQSLQNKQIGLLISCEESYAGATLGLIAQFQELTRYNRQSFVGYCVGFANSRGEIVHDPADPVASAYRLGEHIMDLTETDYRFDSERENNVWAIP
jgi:multimeric flavodoxin WrbA